MKKKLLVLLLTVFIGMLNLKAVESSKVDYKIDDIIIDSKIDASGNLIVKEVLKIDGTYNGYIRDIVYKNDKLEPFEGKDSDFENSDIYNGTNVVLLNVGRIDNVDGEINYNIFEKDITQFNECQEKEKCYDISDINNGISIKMFNETINSSTYFYLEYQIDNVVVNHNDVSEIYYTFIGDSFEDDIKRVNIRLLLPLETKEDIKVWAHGPLQGSIEKIYDSDNKKYYGAYVKVNDLYSYTPVDIRMTFPKELILVDIENQTKHTDIDALNKILKVEQKRADEANKLRKRERIYNQIIYILDGIYLSLMLTIFIYIVIKHDKEYKREFFDQYNREIIEDYDVTVIEYLMDKKITEKAFSTSILNLIYKKKIKVEEIEEKKKDYKLILVDKDNITKAEEKIIRILFMEAGSQNEITLSGLKKYASKIKGTSSPYLSGFESWKRLVTDDSIKENFYEDAVNIKVLSGIYAFMGIVLIVGNLSRNLIGILQLIMFVSTLAFIIYLCIFSKRTRKGNLHYHKWKAFKRFLKDFGRFDEKELPEVILWEKYLVYANILGVADALKKQMEIKFNEYHIENSNITVFDYVLISNINKAINQTIHSSNQTAQIKQSQAIAMSSSSSGSGHGGGFSSGSGFGGGGGGGRGF